jgi:hypothetical protein
MPRPRALRLRPLALAAALAACSACSTTSAQKSLDRFAPADADARARAYLQLLARGEADSAAARLTAELAASSRPALDSATKILRGRQLDSVHVIGAWINVFNGVRHVNLTYEMHSAEGWMMSNVATVDAPGGWQVEGFSVRLLTERLETLNAFSLAGKSPAHYLWLLGCALAFATSVGVALRIALDRARPKRWRWVFLALVGVGSCKLEWSTGAWGVQLFAFQLLSASFLRASPAASWVFGFSLPLGAAVAWWRYRRPPPVADAPVIDAPVIDAPVIDTVEGVR